MMYKNTDVLIDPAGGGLDGELIDRLADSLRGALLRPST